MQYTEMSRTLIWHRPRLQRIAASKAKASLAGANRHRSSGTVGYRAQRSGLTYLDELVQTLLEAVAQRGVPVQLIRHDGTDDC